MTQVLNDPGTLFLITASLLAFAGVLAIALVLTPPETPRARLRAAALGGRRNLGPRAPQSISGKTYRSYSQTRARFLRSDQDQANGAGDSGHVSSRLAQ